MNILAGVDTKFEGKVMLAPGIRVGYLQQEPELNDGRKGEGQEGRGQLWWWRIHVV